MIDDSDGQNVLPIPHDQNADHVTQLLSLLTPRKFPSVFSK